MNLTDVIKNFADFLNQVEQGKDTSPNQAELTQVDVEHPDNSDSVVMIPPLQQKLELLKKSVGVDSAFDGHSAGEEVPSSLELDELDRIKKIAGINLPTAVIQVAGEDSDIE